MTDRHFLAVVTLSGSDLAAAEAQQGATVTNDDVLGALDATLSEVFPIGGDPVRAQCANAVPLPNSPADWEVGAIVNSIRATFPRAE